MKYLCSDRDLVPSRKLLLVDQLYGWTAFHAIFSIEGIEIRKRASVFKFIERSIRSEGKSHRHFLRMTDDDGDTIFHSVVNHLDKKDSNVLKTMFRLVDDSVTKSLLQCPNKRKHTPLRRAFQMRKWEFVEVLLKKCIQFQVLPELTGIRRYLRRTGKSKTLLHKAFLLTNHAAKYLRLHLNTCWQCNRSDNEIKDSLLVPDETGVTPWWYLLDTQRDDEVVKEVILVLVDFGIEVGSLYCDTRDKSNLLHTVFKQRRTELAEFLDARGVDPDQEDLRGRRARNRAKKLLMASEASHEFFDDPESDDDHDSVDSDQQESRCPSPSEHSELVSGRLPLVSRVVCCYLTYCTLPARAAV